MSRDAIRGDVVNGRIVTADRPITFYFVSNQADKIPLVMDELQAVKWIWVDTKYDENKNDYRFYFYFKNIKVSCVHVNAMQHGNTYFKVLGVAPKDANDRLNSVKYGVQLHVHRGIAPVQGELWQLPKNNYSQYLSDWIVGVSNSIKNFRDTVREEVKGEQKIKSSWMSWGEELKGIIAFQDDYERQNSPLLQFEYKNLEPVSSDKVVGVAYKFNLTEKRTSSLDETMINQEMVVSSDTLLTGMEMNLKGLVTEFSEEEGFITLGFQSTVDFGKFPAAGYLTLTAFNISYRIQSRAVDDVIQGKSVNKHLLNILVDGRYRSLPPYKHEEIPKLCKSQEKAVNLAINTEDFLLVQGPPGTGKTSIIVEMIKRFVEQNKRVLISSKNNLAVDNVLEKCIEKGISCVRLGKEEKVKVESVKDRLIDRAAVELQKDIIGNCSKEEIEIISQIEKQKDFCDTLNRNSERLYYYAQCGEQIKVQQGIVRKRESAVKLKNFYIYFQLYWFLLLAFLKNDNVLKQKRRESFSRVISEKLFKDERFLAAYNTIEGLNKERGVSKVILDAELGEKKIYREFQYEDMSVEQIGNALRYEMELQDKFNNKKSIVKEWKEALDERQQSLYPLLLNSVRVVGATCIGINTSAEFKDVDFDVAIVDEAGQITIFDVIVPMSRAKKVILIGDHKQLPPVSDENLEKELQKDRDDSLEEDEETVFDDFHQLLGQSLFEALFHSCPEQNKVMLDEQFRMHPVIAEFISQEFYEGKYKSGLKPSQRELRISAFDKPLYFIDTADMGAAKYENYEVDEDHNVYFNTTEAQIISDILVNLIRDGGKPEEIGVVTPYKRQKLEIERIAVEKLKSVCDGEQQAREMLKKVEIDTVDSFQGRDKDIIVFSFTRSNSENGIGFLRELRRLNVTMTRAKYLLIMVGDSETLTHTRDKDSRKCFTNLISYVKKNGVYDGWNSFKSKLYLEVGQQ